MDEKFFNRPTPVVARELLGKYLVRRIRGREIFSMITETEAYDGFRDKGSHAHRGQTARNAPMFGGAGYWYVYFVYGMHWMLNVVTRESGYPAAVLIRGIADAPGPARLTALLNIGGVQNGKKCSPESGLWVEDRGIKIKPAQIATGPRVGVAYAGRYWASRHLRFRIKQ